MSVLLGGCQSTTIVCQWGVINIEDIFYSSSSNLTHRCSINADKQCVDPFRTAFIISCSKSRSCTITTANCPLEILYTCMGKPTFLYHKCFNHSFASIDGFYLSVMINDILVVVLLLLLLVVVVVVLLLKYGVLNNKYLHFQCFLLLWTWETFWQPFSSETVAVAYEPAVPAAVLNTALLYIKIRIFHRQNRTILIMYKYKDWILPPWETNK